MNWILSWNEWITQFLNRYLPFLMISPLFCLFWTLFGQFLGTFPIRPVLIIPWLLNWIIFWIESPEFILNWIIFWIESWVKQYWIEYWMNHFLAKFKHWIESDWVSPTTILTMSYRSTWPGATPTPSTSSPSRTTRRWQGSWWSGTCLTSFTTHRQRQSSCQKPTCPTFQGLLRSRNMKQKKLNWMKETFNFWIWRPEEKTHKQLMAT